MQRLRSTRRAPPSAEIVYGEGRARSGPCLARGIPLASPEPTLSPVHTPPHPTPPSCAMRMTSTRTRTVTRTLALLLVQHQHSHTHWPFACIGYSGASSSPASPPSERARRCRAPRAPAAGCARQQLQQCRRAAACKISPRASLEAVQNAHATRAASRCRRRWLAVARQRASWRCRASRHRLSACRSFWLVPHGVRSSAPLFDC